MENENPKKVKEIKIPMKFNAGTQKYETDFEKLNEKIEKVNQQKKLTNKKRI